MGRGLGVHSYERCVSVERMQRTIQVCRWLVLVQDMHVYYSGVM